MRAKGSNPIGVASRLVTLVRMSSRDPDRLENWRNWLDDDLFDQIHEIVLQTEVLRSWNEIVDVAPTEAKTDGTFHWWVARNYVVALAVGVRRVVTDRYPGTRSLRNLLVDIQEHTDELTEDWWMSRWWPTDVSRDEAYAEIFSKLSSGKDHVDPEVLQLDLDRLDSVGVAVKDYVDKNLAHLDPDRREHPSITIGDVHEAVDVAYTIFHRWYQLIADVSLGYRIPTQWEHTFAVPWVTPAEADEIAARREAEAAERRLDRDFG